jgi:GT2 family glycosyltransferase/spore maturation protein CgeB
MPPASPDGHRREAEEFASPDAFEAMRLHREVGRLQGLLAADGRELAAARRELERAQEASSENDRQQLVAVSAELRRNRQQLDEYRSRVRELDQTVSALLVGLQATRRDIERAESSKAWQWGHGVTKLARRLTRRRMRTDGALKVALNRLEQIETLTRALPAGESQPTASQPLLEAGPDLPDPADAEAVRARRAALAAEIRDRLGDVPVLDAWPPVSIVVVNRDGRRHLEWLLAGLRDATDYPAFELVVVDNGSSDDSVAFLEQADTPFPVVVEPTGENLSYSAANNRGATRAGNDLLLFLNNDIEPFESGWLRELVAAHARGADAVGATLLHVEGASAEPTVQHRAIRFRNEDGLVRGFNHGDGDDLFGDDFGLELRAPAVTAACLLLSRQTYERVGGFREEFRYGSEDVDLGLSLSAAGDTVVATGRAVLYHRESSTQRREGREFMRVNREINRRVLQERWGPRLRREYRLARLARDPDWTDGAGPHLAITVTSEDADDGWGDWYTAHELGDALTALGWRVTYVARKGDAWRELPEDLDYLLSLMDVFDLDAVPADVVTIAWVRNWTERWLEREWFERADVILASSAGTAQLIEQRTGRSTIPFPLATNPSRFAPGRADADSAADYVFTGNRWGEERAIEAALDPRSGERFAIFGRGWDSIRALKRYSRGPAAYDDLPRIYASSKLVLDDTQGPTLPYGAVNCRVFDALASGSLVVTNCASGVQELFDDEFPVWDSRETLRGQLDALLADEDRCGELLRRYRTRVLSEHTYAHRADRLVEVLREAEERLSFCIKIGAPDAEQAERWGDLHFARAVERQLRRRGHRCRIQTLDRWDLLEGTTDDVVIHLRGRSRYHAKSGQLNVLWCISHPDDLTGEECDGYDLVLVASAPFAQTLRARTKTPVVVLEQATDTEVFYPDHDPRFAHDLVYVANSRNVLRPIVRDLLLTKRDLAVYGANWNGLIDTRYVVGEHIPNDELRKVYTSAKVVLADHWDDMREHGFIANRIYDAVACGAVVICDDVPGLEERFGDAVLTYRDADELRSHIDLLLGDPLGRAARGARGRAMVLDHGDFDGRVAELLDALERVRPSVGHAVHVRSGGAA